MFIKKLQVRDVSRVKKITDAVLSLPVLPTVTARLLQLVDCPKTSASNLSNLVSRDQVLTAKILKMANSSFYGFAREILTVKQAVVVLGFNSLREISLSMSVFNMFKSDQDSKYFSISEFWKHSIAVGLGSRLLARYIDVKDSTEAFTMGILHDIGKLVLNQYLPYDFYQIQKLVFEEGLPLMDAEMEILGATHPQIGAWLAERWNLPVQLEECIRYHHTPRESEKEYQMSLLIYLADHLALQGNMGSSGNNSKGEIPEEMRCVIFNLFNIGEKDLERYAADLKAEFHEKASDLVSEVS